MNRVLAQGLLIYTRTRMKGSLIMDQVNINTTNSTLKAASAKKTEPLSTPDNADRKSDSQSFSQQVERLSERAETVNAKQSSTQTVNAKELDNEELAELVDGENLPLPGNLLHFNNEDMLFKQVAFDRDLNTLKQVLGVNDLTKLELNAEQKLKLSMLLARHPDQLAQLEKQLAGKPIQLVAAQANVPLQFADINSADSLQQAAQSLFKQMHIARNLADVAPQIASSQFSLTAEQNLVVKPLTPQGHESALQSLTLRSDTPDSNINVAPRIQQALTHPQWGNELADRILILSKQNIQQAQIRINPPNLGPLELRISVQNEQANVSFVSNHVQVRDAIESAIPRLREMFADNGFQSLDVDISSNKHGDKAHENVSTNSGINYLDTENELDEDEAQSVLVQNAAKTIGLIDYFV